MKIQWCSLRAREQSQQQEPYRPTKQSAAGLSLYDGLTEHGEQIFLLFMPVALESHEYSLGFRSGGKGHFATIL